MCRNHTITFQCGHTHVYKISICEHAEAIEELNEDEDNNPTHPWYVKKLEECEKDEAKGSLRRERKDVDCPDCLNAKR